MSLKPKNLKKYHLINPICMEEVAEVFGLGAEKYAPFDYLTGTKEQIIDALYRHLNKYQTGEVIDEDSNKSHFAHIIANVLILYTMENLKKPKISNWINFSKKNKIVEEDIKNSQEGLINKPCRCRCCKALIKNRIFIEDNSKHICKKCEIGHDLSKAEFIW